ncbi:MAG: carboxypeptidase-like regulatory domain-containing protein, partial [Bacteroidota bacterium]
MKITFLSLLLSLFSIQALFGQKVSLNGYVKDVSNGEALIGATVLVKEIAGGTTANVYGYYSVTLPPGTYTVEFSYIGYNSVVQTIDLTTNRRLDVELKAEATELDEIVVLGEDEEANVTSVEMSVSKLDAKTIQKIPAFLGEVDV